SRWYCSSVSAINKRSFAVAARRSAAVYLAAGPSGQVLLGTMGFLGEEGPPLCPGMTAPARDDRSDARFRPSSPTVSRTGPLSAAWPPVGDVAAAASRPARSQP